MLIWQADIGVRLLSNNPYIKPNNMTKQKQFGVWMDTLHATVVGNGSTEGGPMTVLAHINGEGVSESPGNKNENNQKTMLQAKFFKEITNHMQNATHLHATGTGQIQERFLHYLSKTPRFKHTKTEESTSNKMSDEKLLEFFAGKFSPVQQQPV
jgi:hypothetical protein